MNRSSGCGECCACLQLIDASKIHKKTEEELERAPSIVVFRVVFCSIFAHDNGVARSPFAFLLGRSA